jgi:hypothetical protein
MRARRSDVEVWVTWLAVCVAWPDSGGVHLGRMLTHGARHDQDYICINYIDVLAEQ